MINQREHKRGTQSSQSHVGAYSLRDYFFQKPGAGPTMTAKNPTTCNLKGYMTKLTDSDILLLKVRFIELHLP